MVVAQHGEARQRDLGREVWRLTALLLGLTAVYAGVRYNVFAGVPLIHAPLFVLNKAVAWTSLLLLVASALWACRGREARKTRLLARRAIDLGKAHVMASLVLQGPADYPAMYAADGRLKLLGELLLLGGVFAATYPFMRAGWARAGALGGLLLHTSALCLASWKPPSLWPGGMPPISLLSSLAALVGLALAVRCEIVTRAPQSRHTPDADP